MMEEFHVAYLAYYPWQDPDEGPDKLVSCRFVAQSKEDALQMAKAKLPQVLAAYTDEQDGATEDCVMIEVRSWAEWGYQLDLAWEAICNTTVPEEDDE
jgi:hypothetical protein